jgi:GDP-4-dehydro-6-deoxy-D-mannose reductase
LLVTGADGFVGRHLVERARAAGWDVHAAEGDLTQEECVSRAVEVIRPNVVIHLASARRLAERDPWSALRVELDMASALLRTLAREVPGATVLAAGSAAQYGTGLPRPLKEIDATPAVSPYGAIKTVLEQVFTSPALTGRLRTIWCRSFNHAGPGQGPEAPLGSWVRQLLAAERRGGGIIRTGALEPVRDVLDVRDVADYYLALVSAPLARGVVNVCSGQPRRLSELAAMVVAQASAPVTIEPDPSLERAVDPPYVVGDPGRLRELTAWAPGIPLQQTVAEMVDAARGADATVPARA